MSSPVVSIIPSAYAPAAQTTLYTSVSVWTRIDKLTVCNSSGSAATITINIVPAGGTVGGGNTTTYQQAVLPGQTFNSPNEYGLVLNPGDFISVVAGTASALTIAAAGTQVTG